MSKQDNKRKTEIFLAKNKEFHETMSELEQSVYDVFNSVEYIVNIVAEISRHKLGGNVVVIFGKEELEKCVEEFPSEIEKCVVNLQKLQKLIQEYYEFFEDL